MKPGTNRLAKYAGEAAAERLKTFAAAARKAAKEPDEADPIHDLRVSIRRLTQVLRVFQDLWDRSHYREMRKKLRKLMDLCGETRNCDIAFEVLKDAGVPASGRIAAYLRKRRKHAADDLAERLKRWKSHGTIRHWEDWLRAENAKAQSVQGRARQAVGPLQREYLKLGPRAVKPETPPEELHQFRLAAKRLRYSLELFGSLAGEGWEQEIQRIREVQELLGAINDCIASHSLISEYEHPSEARASKAALMGLFQQRLETFRDRWHKLYDSKKRAGRLGDLGVSAR